MGVDATVFAQGVTGEVDQGWLGVEKLAEYIARSAHKDDPPRQYSGLPAITHVEAVVNMSDNPYGRALRWLHDVLEDHGDVYPIPRLLELGIPPNLIADLVMISHDPGDDYADYIFKMCDHGSVEVLTAKLHDLAHNQSTLPADHKRHEKYKMAERLVSEARNRRIQQLRAAGVVI